MIVALGSTNPTKISPVKEVFAQHFHPLEIIAISVDSGVSAQPMHDDEIYQGALNRAEQALSKVAKAELGVGIEGGVHQYSYGWFERSLVVIKDRSGKVGIGASGGLLLPKVVANRIQAGETLEEVMDDVFQTRKIGEGIGMFGLMTKKVVTRTSGVAHGVAFALAPFLHPSLYDRT